MTLRASSLCLCVLLFGCASSKQGPSPERAPKDATPAAPLVTLHAESSMPSVAPGSSVWVAVTLRMAPGWHVYWVQPGDSGLPTKLAWNLAPGFTFGPVQFPVPVAFEGDGGVLSVGYNDEVTLLTLVTAAADAPSGGISGQVSWLACRESCVPGSSVIVVPLKVSPDAQRPRENPWAELFARLPKPLESTPGAKVEWVSEYVIEIAVPAKDASLFLGPAIPAGARTTVAARESGTRFIVTLPPNGELPKQGLLGVVRTGESIGLEVQIPERTP